MSEGRSGTTNLVFTISVDDVAASGFPRRALDEPIVVSYQTADMTAWAAHGDYQPVTGTLRFDLLGTSQEVLVPVYGDRLFELDELVVLDLVEVVNASIAVPRGIGTILNDDAAPAFSIDDAAVVEGNAGFAAMAFTVSLSEVSGADAEVDVATADGTARAVDGDYEPLLRHIGISPGSLSARVVVEVTGEVNYEPGETFDVVLVHPANAVLGRARGIGTIVNDDANLGPNLVGNSTFAKDINGWVALGACKADWTTDGVSGPHSVEILGGEGSVFGIDDSPNWVQLTPAEGTRYRVTAWVWGDEADGAAQMQVREYQFGNLARTSLSPAAELCKEAWKQLTLDVVSKHAASTLDLQVFNRPSCGYEGFHVDDVAIQQYLFGDIPPEIDVLASMSIRPRVPFTLDLVVADVDGQTVDALTADVSEFPADNPPVFTTNSAHSDGRLMWTPRLVDLRDTPYVVRFTAMNTSAVVRTASLKVVDAPENLVRNASFEENLGGWQAFGGGSLLRVPGAQDGAWVVEIAGPAVKVEFGIGDLPEWVPIVASEGAAYEFSAWVRSESDHGAASLRVIEMNGTSIVGTATSPDLELTSSWTRLSVQYTTRMVGSSLSLEVVNLPVVAPAKFQVDQVVAQIVGQGVVSNGGGGGARKPRAAPEASAPIRTMVQPNPARGAATLSVTLARPGPLHIALFDASGRIVRVLAAGETFTEGTNHFALGRARGGVPLPNGIYLYRVRSNAGDQVGKFVILE